MTRNKALRAKIRLGNVIRKREKRNRKRNSFTVVWPETKSAGQYRIIMDKYYHEWMKANAHNR